VWLAPSSLEALALTEPTPSIVCLPCLADDDDLPPAANATIALALLVELAARRRRREEARPAD